jgi:hypothetical protein
VADISFSESVWHRLLMVPPDADRQCTRGELTEDCGSASASTSGSSDKANTRPSWVLGASRAKSHGRLVVLNPSNPYIGCRIDRVGRFVLAMDHNGDGILTGSHAAGLATLASCLCTVGLAGILW